uniref:Uncharacterized protein n=1 Tax=Cacopsylla melanoneura TaxID=428564 RepID=A0A8D8ZDB5_9HEMI
MPFWSFWVRILNKSLGKCPRVNTGSLWALYTEYLICTSVPRIPMSRIKGLGFGIRGPSGLKLSLWSRAVTGGAGSAHLLQKFSSCLLILVKSFLSSYYF